MNRLARLPLVRQLVVASLFLFLVTAAQAQVNNVTDDTSTPIEGAGHDYIKMLSETVNPANGSISLRIQVPTPKGRGISIPFSFSYDSNSVHHLIPWSVYGQVIWTSNIGYLSQGGWNYSVPMASIGVSDQTAGTYPNFYTCVVSTNYMFSDASGGQHALGLGTKNPPSGENCPNPPVSTGGDPQVGASIGATVQNPNLTNPTVFTGDGTVYRFGATGEGSQAYNGQGYFLANSIEDRNGNIVTGTDNGGGSFVFKDTAGRTLISSNGFGPSGTTNSVSFSGLDYQVTWKTVSASFSVSTPIWTGPANEPSQYDQCEPIPSANDSQTVISKITLPNGQSYNFYYGTDVSPHGTATNPYALLSEVDYPSGGWVTYTWKLSDQPNELADYPGWYNAGSETCSTDFNVICPAPVPDGCLYKYAGPVVASRSVGFGETSTPSLTQAFTYSTTWVGAPSALWTQKGTSVTSTDGVTGKSALTSYSYSPVPAPFPAYSYGTFNRIPVESATSVYDWGNTSTPLLTHVKTWYDQFDLATDTTEVLVGGSTLMSEVVYCYVGTNCVPSSILSQLNSKSEYGYGTGAVGPLLRQTVTTFQAFSGTPGYITDAPCQVIIYDGNNNRYAETDYLYDGGSTLCATVSSSTSTTGVTVVSGTHDETTFGPTKTTPRGNLTQKTQWASTGSSPVSSYTYDETGQVLTKTEPCGTTTCADIGALVPATQYFYADSYTTGSSTCTSASGPAGNTNALLTKVVYPSTNGVAHSECFSYDYASGQLTGSKDQNGQLTTYAYSDPFLRPTLASYPDGGQTTISYNDVPPSPSVTTTKLISSGVNLSTTTVMDGMGHVVQSQVTTDPEGTDYVDTSYDGMGRALTVSNPHRSATLPTDGTTTNTYDGMGRTIAIQRPDGSSAQTLYDQACIVNTTAVGTIVTDETGKIRESCSDGLGRLIEVDEPGNSGQTGAPGTGSVTFSGTEQGPVATCPQQYGYCYVWDSGTFDVTVDGVLVTVSYSGCASPCQSSTSSSIASSLVTAINGDSSIPVTATANGATVTLTANTNGSDSDYPLSVSLAGHDTQWFSSPSFSISASGSALTEGGSGGLGTGSLVTQYAYDTLGNMICAVQKGTDTTAFSTCASASANWRPRSFAYDSLSRLTSAVNPESGSTTYTYDLNGNVATKIVPKAGQTGTQQTTHNYNYDVLSRLLKDSHVDPNSGVDEYSYDGTALTTGCGQNPPTITSTNAVGRRSAMCGAQSGSSWSFDPMGRALLESTRNHGSAQTVLTINYTYNKDGSLNKLTYPSGDVVTYVVGGAGRTTQVTDSTNNFVMSATYAPPGLLTGMTNGSGITTVNSYNDRLQPFMLSAGPAAGAIFSVCYDFHSHVALSNSKCSFPSYTTGNNGNVFQVANNLDSTRSAVFTYDPLNRMSQANTVNTSSSNCWGETYTIDNWGNLTNRAAPTGMAGNCTTEGLSATATTSNQLSGLGMAYDAAGNVTTDNVGNAYTYDSENRIATVAGYTYSYDADGTRMEKTTGSSGTMYWMGPSGALTETSLAGTINEEYVYFNGQRIARIDRPTGAVYYYFSDKLGSASVIANASGTVQERYFYYPYGGMQSSSGSDPNHYKFTGKERDSESNLDQFGARYYTSSIGRFMTPDWAARPIGVPYAEFGDPQSLNLYTYVRNDPVTRADADGHQDTSNTADCKDSGGNQCGQTVAATKAQNSVTVTSSGIQDGHSYVKGTVGVDATRDSNGNITSVSYTTATANFSAKEGNAGAFEGVVLTTTTTSYINGIAQENPTTSSVTQGYDVAVKMFGASTLSEASQNAFAKTDELFVRAVASDAYHHPIKYAIHAAGLALPFLHVPQAIEGIATGVEALITANDLVKETQ